MSFPVPLRAAETSKLKSKYNIRGIPPLSSSHRLTVLPSTNGRGQLTNNPNGCLAEWKKKVVVTPPEKLRHLQLWWQDRNF